MIFRYADPASGATLSVCDDLCALGVKTALGQSTFVRVEEGVTPSHTECIFCGWCGSLLVANGICTWHDECPEHSYATTVPAALIAKLHGVQLTDAAFDHLEHLMAETWGAFGHVDAERVLRMLRRG